MGEEFKMVLNLSLLEEEFIYINLLKRRISLRLKIEIKIKI